MTEVTNRAPKHSFNSFNVYINSLFILFLDFILFFEFKKMFSLLSNVFPVKYHSSSDFSDLHHQNSIILMSKDFSCKSSILFQTIKSVLKEYEEIHYIISGNDKIKEMPKHINQMPALDLNNGSVLELLKVYYLSTYDSLVNHLLGIQSSNLCPIAIIVEDIYHYIKQFNERIERTEDKQSLIKRIRSEKEDKQLLAELSTLLINTGNNCGQKLKKTSLIVMALDIDNDLSEEYQVMAKSIGHRFFHNIWTIEKTNHSSDEPKLQMFCESSNVEMKLDITLSSDQFSLNQISRKT